METEKLVRELFEKVRPKKFKNIRASMIKFAIIDYVVTDPEFSEVLRKLEEDGKLK